MADRQAAAAAPRRHHGDGQEIGSALNGKAITKELLVAVLKRVEVTITAETAAKFVPFLGSAVAAGISLTAMRMLRNRHVEDGFAVARSLVETDKHQGRSIVGAQRKA